MTAARITRRPRAQSDIESAVDWLAGDASTASVESFFNALEDALTGLAMHPFKGMDWGQKVGVPGLRALPLQRHPYVVLCLANEAAVDVIRMLHTSRDIDLALLVDER